LSACNGESEGGKGDENNGDKLGVVGVGVIIHLSAVADQILVKKNYFSTKTIFEKRIKSALCGWNYF
jgi:hypothetical protein